MTFAACFEESPPPRRGPFAFYYGPALSDEALAWYSRFDLLITQDPLPKDQVDRLHAAGTRLLVYEWSVAFYQLRATEWQRSLPREALLNSTPLTGGVGSKTSAAWYFDPASPEHEMGRVNEIVQRLEQSGYDGVFFDTTTFASVHPEARKEYDRRHPDTPYDLAFSRFLSRLREKLSNGVLFTNQGYRSAEHYLPYVDWDLTESLITWSRNGAHAVRPWNDRADPWNSIHFVMRTLIEPVAARYPNVRFGHLNYVDGDNPEAIRLAVAIAQLFGGEGYVAAPTTSDEVNPIYFRNFGKPTSPRIDVAEGKLTYRSFEHGLIAVAGSAEDLEICGGAITIAAAHPLPQAFFFDRMTACDPGR